MLKLRKSEERGQATLNWLKSWHTFSFGEYRDPAHIHHRSLRVINQDIIAPGGGFPPHPHEDMEIITYIIRGRLAHEDSLGSRQEIGPGEIQRMTAGQGITHSEFNASSTEETELLQIWIIPAVRGLPPGYEQKNYESFPVHQCLRKLASPNGDMGSVKIHQDVTLYKGELTPTQSTTIKIGEARHGWLQLIQGKLTVDKYSMHPGDGLAVSKTNNLTVHSDTGAEFLFFDLA